ncbi:thioredoxin [Cytobacillus sp. IB215665]|uniref:thioredoxin n=1 Tax=Cytobacillus sp. IB215665 TaxID=3097357 RepID=UPI002A0B6672|nr:thioredoxin [Cytobacillus sp. IB215665]MDX8366288.1 thioredoxin [Cytobacillus sp. IB215665]
MINAPSLHVSDKSFANETNDGLVLVDFWAQWCTPCKMIGSILEDLDQEFSHKLKIVKLDVDGNELTVLKYGIMNMPTLLLLNNGEVIDKVVGYRRQEQLVSLITKHL